MVDNVIINKCEIIERCVGRVEEIYATNMERFESDYNVQDALILNLQRAREATIDLAAHLVRIRKLGVPKTSKEFFKLLSDASVVPKGLSERLQGMVGFRNIAVHNYQEVDLGLVQEVLQRHLGDFASFVKYALKLA